MCVFAELPLVFVCVVCVVCLYFVLFWLLGVLWLSVGGLCWLRLRCDCLCGCLIVRSVACVFAMFWCYCSS